MNTEDTEHATTPFIVVYFYQGGSLSVSPGQRVYITYCTFTWRIYITLEQACYIKTLNNSNIGTFS